MMRQSNQLGGLRRVVLAVGVLAVGALHAAPLVLWPSELCEAHALPASKQTVGEGRALHIEAGKDYDWPGVRLGFKSGACDLSAYDALRVTLRNVGSAPAEIFCCLKNRQPKDCFLSPGGSVFLQPGEQREIDACLRLPPWVVDRPLGLVGMRGVPGPAAGSIFDLSQTHEIHLCLNSPRAPATFEVVGITAEVRESSRVLLAADTFFPFVDRFGQFAHGEWPGKVHSEDELQRAKERESVWLASASSPAERDRWGGWTRGPQLKATGRFRTEKVKGAWWLVDPDGRLFFSHGVGCVFPGSETGVTGRERYFSWLPEPGSAFGAFYVSGGRMLYRAEGAAGPYRTYDFAKANLLRKYGAGWEATFAELAHRRLRAWGLNTVANWSDERVCQLRRTPYTATVNGASRTIANQCPDPFAPAFAEEVRRSAQALRQSGAADDPWCVGCFVDNEIGWGHDGRVLVRESLRLPADRPVKQAVTAWLQKKYATPAELNAVWGSSFDSWEAFQRNTEIPESWACGADCEGFLPVLAERYFATVREAVKSVAPDLLYLGCRFSWGPDAVYRVASAHCDVVSVNLYRRTVCKDLPSGCADKPLMIGEFHFGAMDRGLFHTGLGQTRDQAERAACYKAYVRSGLAHPRCVGTHWFQWRDQALTGRGDGENYPVGFLTLTDQPYAELVAAAREVGETLYTERYGRSH
jgi:hypothetical protein